MIELLFSGKTLPMKIHGELEDQIASIDSFGPPENVADHLGLENVDRFLDELRGENPTLIWKMNGHSFHQGNTYTDMTPLGSVQASAFMEINPDFTKLFMSRYIGEAFVIHSSIGVLSIDQYLNRAKLARFQFIVDTGGPAPVIHGLEYTIERDKATLVAEKTYPFNTANLMHYEVDFLNGRIHVEEDYRFHCKTPDANKKDGLDENHTEWP